MISIVILVFVLLWTESPSALIFAALLHEAAHLILGLIFWGELPRVSLSLCGIKMKWERGGRIAEELLLSLAGPAVNLLMWALLPKHSILAVYSLSLAIFNLLPAEGLDGGEIIKKLSLLLFGERRARAVCGFFTAAAVGLMFFATCAASLIGEFNLPLLLVTLFLIIRIYGRK